MLGNKLFVTPSPNEIEMLLQQQTMLKRKQRLRQVRDQGQVIAKNIRENVVEHRKRALQDLASELNKQYVVKQQEQFEKVKKDYADGLENVGSAHTCASETDTDQALFEAKFELKKKIAKQRFTEAIKQLRMIKSLEEKENMARVSRKKLVTHKENVRAKRIAMLPKPEKSSDEETTYESSKSTFDSSGTRTTSQSSVIFVERASKTEQNAYEDAKKAATLEQEKYQGKEETRVNNEITQREKAKFRHLAALKQTRMQNEYKSLENDLKYLQMKDARKRREAIPTLPQIPSLDVSLQDLMA